MGHVSEREAWPKLNRIREISNRDAILEQLDRVLDPELDRSILELGFVESLDIEGGRLVVVLHFPTYFCAPNFAYMMAEDVRRALLEIEGVEDVTVRIKDHAFSAAIEAGVNNGNSFAEAFPGEAFENLEHLRDLFLRKGYLRRQADLLRALRNAGLSAVEIVALRVQDVECRGEVGLVRCGENDVRDIGSAEVVQRYLQRRADLGLDCSPTAPLIVNLRGDPVTSDELEAYFVRVRTVQVSLEANNSLCSALLAQRRAAMLASGTGVS